MIVEHDAEPVDVIEEVLDRIELDSKSSFSLQSLRLTNKWLCWMVTRRLFKRAYLTHGTIPIDDPYPPVLPEEAAARVKTLVSRWADWNHPWNCERTALALLTLKNLERLEVEDADYWESGIQPVLEEISRESTPFPNLASIHLESVKRGLGILEAQRWTLVEITLLDIEKPTDIVLTTELPNLRTLTLDSTTLFTLIDQQTEALRLFNKARDLRLIMSPLHLTVRRTSPPPIYFWQ